MRRSLLIPIVAGGLVVLCATASADVRVRIGVQPDSIARCSPARFAATVWNTGADSIRVRVAITLTLGDTLTLGPITGRVRLGPHEVRSRSVDFTVPPGAPPGSYAFAIQAAASDSTHDRSVAPFAIVPGTCPPTGDPAQALLLAAVAASLDLAPDLITPVIQETWGGVKLRYLPVRPKQRKP